MDPDGFFGPHGHGGVVAAEAQTLPWAEKTAPHRLPPRECVLNARISLDKTYHYDDRAAVPLLIEAVDWLRRALEQMAEWYAVTAGEPGASAGPGVGAGGSASQPRSEEARPDVPV